MARLAGAQKAKKRAKISQFWLSQPVAKDSMKCVGNKSVKGGSRIEHEGLVESRKMARAFV